MDSHFPYEFIGLGGIDARLTCMVVIWPSLKPLFKAVCCLIGDLALNRTLGNAHEIPIIRFRALELGLR